jgi:hypothetical protein
LDARQFDGFAKALGSGAHRRRVLGVLTGGLVAALGSRQVTQAQGNSGCAHFCQDVFPPGRERGECVSAAARGDAGNLCAACGADPTCVIVDDDTGALSCSHHCGVHGGGGH